MECRRRSQARRRGISANAAPINYDWFVLALDLLCMVGAVYFMFRE